MFGEYYYSNLINNYIANKMYRFINDPKSNKNVSISSPLGKEILKNYLTYIKVGGSQAKAKFKKAVNVVRAVDKLSKAGKFAEIEILKKADDAHKAFKKDMRDVFTNSKEFGREFTFEAMTGKIKFGD